MSLDAVEDHMLVRIGDQIPPRIAMPENDLVDPPLLTRSAELIGLRINIRIGLRTEELQSAVRRAVVDDRKPANTSFAIMFQIFSNDDHLIADDRDHDRMIGIWNGIAGC